jgi:hypothetical protein
MPDHVYTSRRVFDVATWANLPAQERVVDRLGDLLLAADDLLDMLSDSATTENLRDITPTVQQVYDQVNGLMKRLAD